MAKEVQKVWFGRVLSTEASDAMELGVGHRPTTWMFPNLNALWALYFEDFYRGFIMQAWSIVNSISSLSYHSIEWGRGGLKNLNF